jgi:hypothetical protein
MNRLEPLSWRINASFMALEYEVDWFFWTGPIVNL